MELVLVGSGPWKRVVQPWSWGNGTRLWNDVTDSLFFWEHKKTLHRHIMTYSNMGCRETAYFTWGDRQRGLQKVEGKNNSTEHDMYDFAWHSLKSQSFWTLSNAFKTGAAVLRCGCSARILELVTLTAKQHLYKDFYNILLVFSRISGFLVFFVCFSPGSDLWNTDFNQIFGGLARLAWSWATCSAHCCEQTRTTDLICEWPWWIMRQGSIICAPDRMTWLEVGQRHPWH